MIKPNIRGVEKHLLQISPRGWQHRPGSFLVRFRYPWRSAWVARAFQSSELEPRLSRSGYVYLIENYKHTVKAGEKAKRFRRVVASSILASASIVALNFALDISQRKAPNYQVSSGPVGASERKTESSCSEILLKPAAQIEQWLEGQLTPQVAVEELNRNLLGGFQRRTVKIKCEELTATFRLTLSKHQQELHLKNFARLEK